jgi:general secretion pathway protein J
MHSAARHSTRPCARLSARGFTLIELLVALAIMAMMTVVSWRGLDAMARAQTQIERRGDALLTLQAGLAQWAADLDAQVQLDSAPSPDWDGRALRIVRNNTAAPGDGLLVVAWTQRTVDGVGQWLRWQSPPLTTQGALQTALARATQWATNPGDLERRFEVSIAPLDQWSVQYFRNGTWAAATAADTAPPAPVAPLPAGVTIAPKIAPVVIEGVRLSITLPAGDSVSGTLTRDWVRASVGPGRP